MSILLFPNDKGIYCQILLGQGRIPGISLLNYFNKTKDMSPTNALNIAGMRNLSEGLCTRFRRPRGINFHHASISVTFSHYDNGGWVTKSHDGFVEMAEYHKKYRMIEENQEGVNSGYSTPPI